MSPKEQEAIMNKLEELTMTQAKRYLSQRQAQVIFSLGEAKLRQYAEEAGAVRKLGKRVLINAEVLYEYIESMYS